MSTPIPPLHPDEEPPSNWLLIVAILATFLAGFVAGTAFMIASGSCRAEASSHIAP